MASARTAAVSWWHGRSESSRKLPGRGRVERLFANAISGLSSNKTRNKLPKTRHRSRTGSESWRRVSVAGGTAFLHHSVRDEPRAAALPATASDQPCYVVPDDAVVGCTSHPPGTCNPSIYGLVGTMKPPVFGGRASFATWEPSVRRTRS